MTNRVTPVPLTSMDGARHVTVRVVTDTFAVLEVEKITDIHVSTTTSSYGGGGMIVNGAGSIGSTVTTSQTSVTSDIINRIYYKDNTGTQRHIDVVGTGVSVLKGNTISLVWLASDGHQDAYLGFYDHAARWWYGASVIEDFLFTKMGLGGGDMMSHIKFGGWIIFMACCAWYLAYAKDHTGVSYSIIVAICCLVIAFGAYFCFIPFFTTTHPYPKDVAQQVLGALRKHLDATSPQALPALPVVPKVSEQPIARPRSKFRA